VVLGAGKHPALELELLLDPELDVEDDVDASSLLVGPDELPERFDPLEAPFDPGDPPDVPGSLDDPFDDE
jgi:hypothetical protein